MEAEETGQGGPPPPQRKREFTAFKLIVDPALVKASFKSYRYDGRLPEDPTYPTIIVRDPRNRGRPQRLEDLELPVPLFKIDKNYVGPPPAIQVTVTNLNDNIDRNFFKNILTKHCAEGYEEFHIYHHPVTNRHLGVARVTFKRPAVARYFIEKVNGTSIMGQKINAFVDAHFVECFALVEELTTEKKKKEKEKEEKEKKKKKEVKEEKGKEGSPPPPPPPSAEKGGVGVAGNGVGGGQGEFPYQFQDGQQWTDGIASQDGVVESQGSQNNEDYYSPKVDLDTRIRQVFAGSRSSFLGRIPLLDSSDSEDDKPSHKRRRYGKEQWSSPSEEDTVETAFAKKFKKNTFMPVDESSSNQLLNDMSPPPSPFLAMNAIDSSDIAQLQSLKAKLQAELERVAREDQESPIVGMDDPSLISLPPDPPLPPDMPPPPPAEPLPTEPTLVPQTPYYLPPGGWTGYPGMPYAPYMWTPGMECPQGYFPYPNHPDMGYEPCSEEEDEEITPLEVTKLVIDKIYEELKGALFKDFQKRLLESEAYRKFDLWCQKREEFHKTSTKQQQEAKSAAAEISQPPKIPEPEFSVAVPENGIGISLSLARQIPKFPSFRIRKPEPPPPEEGSTPFSKSETEDDSLSSVSSGKDSRKKSRSIRRLKISSSESSSSSGSSSSSEFSSSEESELEELHFKKKSEKASSPSKAFKLDTLEAVSSGGELSEINTESELETLDEVLPKPEVKPEADVSVRSEDSDHLLDHNYSRPADDPEAEGDPSFYRSQVKQKLRLAMKAEREVEDVFPRSRRIFPERDADEKTRILYDIFYSPIDDEDLEGFKIAFERSLAFDSNSYWLNSTHWVEYPPTATSPKKPKDRDTRVHHSASARTEGFYRLTKSEKAANRRQWGNISVDVDKGATGANLKEYASAKVQVALSREARSNQRRLLTALGPEVESDLLKFNQLKFRKKSLRFGRSTIHDWGLFASEDIAADEMVIEYVGQMIRPVIADLREKKYEAVGIGSSYLFRVDLETIIDATRCGNLSRFINHSCNPNCYAKIITIEGRKKIVIYSKQPICRNEEITYDYKFPIEDEKIPCLCGSIGCRGTLN